MHSRRVFRITGEDRVDFLQNLVTNDVNRLSEGLVWAALLTPQGKYLCDFFLVPGEDAILLDVAEPLADMLVQRLGMYKLRAKVAIELTDIEVSRGSGAAPEVPGGRRGPPEGRGGGAPSPATGRCRAPRRPRRPRRTCWRSGCGSGRWSRRLLRCRFVRILWIIVIVIVIPRR